MAKTRKNLGNWGENKAEEYLIKKNFMILARNFRTAFGEIDIIAEKNGRTTFVEVKTRTNNRFGNPEDSVNKPKKTKLIESAMAYMQEHPELGDSWQIDVIAIYKETSVKFEVLHFPNAMDGNE